MINNTNNGSINNISNTNNGTINIVKFGSEDISSILSQSEVLKILNRKLCSLEESIKLIHFNEKRPQLKNIYITIFMYKAFALYINVNWEMIEKELCSFFYRPIKFKRSICIYI